MSASVIVFAHVGNIIGSKYVTNRRSVLTGEGSRSEERGSSVRQNVTHVELTTGTTSTSDNRSIAQRAGRVYS